MAKNIGAIGRMQLDIGNFTVAFDNISKSLELFEKIGHEKGKP